MNLAIDIGNTVIKTGLFDDNRLLEKQNFPSVDHLKQFINVRSPMNVIASSTSSEIFNKGDWDNDQFLIMNNNLNFPFTIDYKTPETLGSDRLAGIAGSTFFFPGNNVLVIDMGTCITYDFISAENIYSGGAISPGLIMRFKAMNKYTARLPELSVPVNFPDLIGNSTASCMESGVINGILFEAEGVISAYREKYGHLKIIITGGDAHIFEKKFKGPIFATPELILFGLNVILQNNVANI